MAPLPSDLRKELEKAVVRARDTAEAGAASAIEHLGVDREPAPAGLTSEQRALRVALRAQARALGREVAPFGLDELREEIAYAAWHRMLFARFLAENGLLVHPASRSPVSMADVAELAQSEGESDPWVVAARYAAEMLPGIFGTTDPTTKVTLAPDDRLRLEGLLKELPVEVFTADDALGWVYQFWQSKRKKEVNAKGDKIGGADLAPVTQLFTEHYMVRFLLENSLGAWWAGRHPDSPLLKDWEYLRYRDDGSPAAGTFEGWPGRASEITVMDPCCGSGHFLVAAADMLRAMRMEEEGLTVEQAAEAVLRDNLFGLELDPRCTQIAAFALAFDAWKVIGRAKPLPVPNLACSGIAIKGQRDDWHKLAGGDDKMAAALDRLYDLFIDAPELGSLIDPRAAAQEGTIWAVDPDQLIDTLEQALQRETANDPAAAVFGGAAAGTAKAARLLSGRYWLVATNPPFLGRGKQGKVLRAHLDAAFDESRQDLATVFVQRGRSLLLPHGGLSIVTPQNWLIQVSYEDLRANYLRSQRFALVAILGEEAFEAFGIRGPRVVLLHIVNRPAMSSDMIASMDVSTPPGSTQILITEKVARLKADTLNVTSQHACTRQPGLRIVFTAVTEIESLRMSAQSHQGVKTGDDLRLRQLYWEVQTRSSRWLLSQGAPLTSGRPGIHYAVAWGRRGAALARAQGTSAWGKQGVAVSLTRHLAPTLYVGAPFFSEIAAIVPTNQAAVPALTSFAAAGELERLVREIDRATILSNSTLLDVPFDLEHWTKVAAEQYPDGLPEPHSDDPTQWLFKGKPVGSDAPLQVAVARLLGYRWPDQGPDELDDLVDPDGIVCLPSVAGDAPASERLERLLARAFGDDWTLGRRAQLLESVGSSGLSLETWLRDEFFTQHARLFHNRPFIWHVWDGRKDGFSALLHYHRLDRATLEKLTYTQLGDWIERQRAAQVAGEAGADARLAAAIDLQRKLAAILSGEPPFDIYVRWKSMAEQPIGWEPDLDDGVRLNIRPFVEAGILRSKFTINWNKDRGKDPDGSERHNDRHFSVAEKRAARAERR